MSNILQIGFVTEGSTDVRFLKNILWKTFQHVAFDCNTSIEVYEPEELTEKNGATYKDQILDLSIKYNYFHVICIHRDSDSPTIDKTLQLIINPAFESVQRHHGDNCKNLVPIIPVQMTEAWMLADTELLRNKIGTKLTSAQLGLPNRINQIESISDPKYVINSAIRIAQSHSTKRRRHNLSISNLYSPISQEISIGHLEKLSSFLHFKEGVRESFKRLNYHIRT